MEVVDVVAFCNQDDVEQRLRRPLTDGESEYLGGMIEEAQALVVSHLGCGDDVYPENDAVPTPVRLVTSRMVARVISEGEAMDPQYFGATQVGRTSGPFSQQATFAAGSRTGAPWMTKVDRDMLAPYQCGGKAFSVDAVPNRRVWHAETCSAVELARVPGWYAGICTCGASLAGVPTPGVGE